VKRAVIAAVATGLLSGSMAFADWDNNYSFETDYTDSWYSYNPAETTNSSDFAFEGVQSLKFTTPDVAGDTPVNYTVVDYPHNAAVPGQSYTASVQYYVDSALKDTENLSIGMYWLWDNGGSFAYSTINQGTYTALGNTPGSETVGAWTEISVTDTAPADAEFLMVALEVAGDGSAFYFDRVVVIPEPATIALFGMGLAAVAIRRRRNATVC